MKSKRCIINVLKYIFFITLCIGIVSAISSQTVKSTTAYVSSISVECVNLFEGIATEPTTQTSSTEQTTDTVPAKPTESTVPTKPTEPSSTQSITETTVQPSSEGAAATTPSAESTSPTSQGSSPTTTGDRNNIEWYVICIIISAMGFAICWRLGKDKN
uniref:hypothetical protein n=1 Tax=uncultured Ruminococcus sp. TaxID=165186 RepID=UPI0025ED83E4|nr:hypothetical protein [uncultured Ruminococcus sp.]